MPRAANITAMLKRLTLFQWALIITILYLFWQISLSGAILMAGSEEASRSLSALAKRTVGFGAALFVFRAALRKLGWIIALALAIPLGLGAMRAEDALVNHFAARASGQERLEARTILLFNTALTNGSASLPGLAKDIAEDKARLAAFTKVLGFAIWNNKALMTVINAQAEPLLAAVYGQEACDKVDREYARYVETFNAAQDKLARAEQMFRQSNFAAWRTQLNKRLAAYAACMSDACRQNVQASTERDMQTHLGDMSFPP